MPFAVFQHFGLGQPPFTTAKYRVARQNHKRKEMEKLVAQPYFSIQVGNCLINIRYCYFNI